MFFIPKNIWGGKRKKCNIDCSTDGIGTVWMLCTWAHIAIASQELQASHPHQSGNHRTQPVVWCLGGLQANCLILWPCALCGCAPRVWVADEPNGAALPFVAGVRPRLQLQQARRGPAWGTPSGTGTTRAAGSEVLQSTARWACAPRHRRERRPVVAAHPQCEFQSHEFPSISSLGECFPHLRFS